MTSEQALPIEDEVVALIPGDELSDEERKQGEEALDRLIEQDSQRVMFGMASAARRARQTHCLRDHLFDTSNTYRTTGGARRCRACARQHQRKARIRA